MKPILSCKFNMDTASVELKFLDGTTLTIDTIAVEDQFAVNMFERSELDYLIYNDPVGYAENSGSSTAFCIVCKVQDK